MTEDVGPCLVAAIRRGRDRSNVGSDEDYDDRPSGGGSSTLGPEGKRPVVEYTKEERAARIARFKEKKAQWTYKKRIIYACRKTFADSRPRVGGRFVKKTPEEAAAQNAEKQRMKVPLIPFPSWEGGR